MPEGLKNWNCRHWRISPFHPRCFGAEGAGGSLQGDETRSIFILSWRRFVNCSLPLCTSLFLNICWGPFFVTFGCHTERQRCEKNTFRSVCWGQCWFNMRKGEGRPLCLSLLAVICLVGLRGEHLRGAVFSCGCSPEWRVTAECPWLYPVNPLFCLTHTVLILFHFFFSTTCSWRINMGLCKTPMQWSVNLAGLRSPSLEGYPLGLTPWMASGNWTFGSFLNADKTVLPTRDSEDLLPCQQLCLVAVPAWPASNKTPDLWVLSGFPWAEVLHTCCWILPEEEACSEWPMRMGRRRENVGSLAWIPPDPARYVPLPLPIPVVNYIFLYSLL